MGKVSNRQLNGPIIHSKAIWVEEGEKNSKYFLNLEKKTKKKTQYMSYKKVISRGNTEIIDLNAILQKQKDYYENLYKSKYATSDILSNIEHSLVHNSNRPKLCELDKEICENPL